MEPIAYIRSPFIEKFGIPRQSGLAPHVTCRIEFTPPYRHPDFIRGLEGFSHIWLIWGFHHNAAAEVRATVRPPRLGGNTRLGVFATRSSFRPNGLGLSAVSLVAVEEGPTLLIAGADMAEGTPVYDIKPYLPWADAIPNASGGFAAAPPAAKLQVEWPEEAAALLAPDMLTALQETLSQDPRPAYQSDPARIYHIVFHPYEIDFTVSGNVLKVQALRHHQS